MIQSSQFPERDQPADRSRVLSRRGWFLGTLWGIAGMRAAARAQSAPQARADANEAEEIAEVKAIAKKAGLGPFSLSRTEHFLCLGDTPVNTPVKFSETALDRCEELTKAFLPHFRDRGFRLELPQRRLTVIALKDAASYGAYLGEPPGDEIGGQYDLDTNRLVIFDFRPKRAELAADPERVNLFTLVHETTHLLCFNAGLLSRRADVPHCISEGLATYVELWRPGDRKAKIGVKNRPRLGALIGAQNNAERWIPIADILANDDVVQNKKTGQLAYAESWLLVHFLLQQNSAMLTKFKDYLAEMPAAAGAANRLKHAEARLGSLKTLNSDVNRHAKRVVRQG